MKFYHQYEEGSTKITFVLDRDIDLDKALEEFGNFLLACGYRFDGHLEIVKDGNNE